MLSPCVCLCKAPVFEKFSGFSQNLQIMINYDCLAQCSLITPNSWLLRDCPLLKGLHLKNWGLLFVSPAEILVLLFQCPRHLASDSLLLLWTLTKSGTVSHTWLPLCLGHMSESHLLLCLWAEADGVVCTYPVVTGTSRGCRGEVLGESWPGCHAPTTARLLSFWVTRRTS